MEHEQAGKVRAEYGRAVLRAFLIISHENLVGDIPSRPYAICDNFTEPFQNAPQCGANLSKLRN